MALFGINILQHIHSVWSFWLPYFFSFPLRLLPLPSCFILAHFLSTAASFCLRNSSECPGHGMLLFLASAIELKLCFTTTQNLWLTSTLTNSDLLPRNWNFLIFFLPLIYLLPHLLQTPSPSTYPPSLILLQRLSGLLFDFTAFHSNFAHKTTLLLQNEILFSLLSYPKYA